MYPNNSISADGGMLSQPWLGQSDYVWNVEIGSEARVVSLRLISGAENNDPTLNTRCIGESLHNLFEILPGDSVQLDMIVKMVVQKVDFHSLPIEIQKRGEASRHYVLSKLPVSDLSANGSTFFLRISDTTTFTAFQQANSNELAYYKAIMKYSPNYVVAKDIEGRYVHINPTAEKMLGVTSSDVVGLLPDDVLSPDVAAKCLLEDYTVLENEQVVHIEQEFGNDDNLHFLRTVKFPAFDAKGCMVGVCAVGTDITKFKTVERQLYHESNFDLLTEIPNRLLGFDRLQQSMARARRTNKRVGLVVLDLGKFSAVNDAFGVTVGDQLLIEAAWRLRACVRDCDTVARLGGDQFALVLTEIDDGVGVKIAAEKVFRQLRLPFTIDDRLIAIAPSIGVSIFPDDALSAAELVANAESALGHAKQSGRNIVKTYDGDISREIGLRHRISTLLGTGLQNDEFYLEYQPLVDPSTGMTLGAEALLRWNSAELGPIGPDQFIPIAEDNGQIHDIGEWVLRRACIAAEQWNRGLNEGVPVAVNVSPKQVVAHNFTKTVERALRESRLDPALLKLEITETAFASEADTFRSTFISLSDMGISLSLDDFGTGYSSLGYLRACPFNIIKIDRSFLADVNDDPDSQVLLESIVRLAKSIGLTVVAEGVETSQQASILRDLKCDQLQGFRFSRPLSEEAFVHFISDESLECKAA